MTRKDEGCDFFILKMYIAFLHIVPEPYYHILFSLTEVYKNLFSMLRHLARIYLFLYNVMNEHVN